MRPSTDTPAIRTRALACTFGPVPAVAGLDLEVARGEMFGLVGPDGAGKSTAIRLLCGLQRPSGGEATILGFDLRREAPQVKAQIGYLSQEFTLYGDLTVDENLAFFGDVHGVRNFRQRRDELLAFTRLAPFRDRLAAALSGGMKKKLALACTLVHTPGLLLLDEPSTGVDPVSRGEFWSILSDVLEQGVTILMTTPYLDEAERCHRISLMHAGRIVRTGTPDEIRAAMPGRMFDVAARDARAAYALLRKQWPSSHLALLGEHVRFWSPDGQPAASACAAALEAASLGPVSCTPAAPSLEDAFIGLLEHGE
jgi:ABC-2 type transport system ATP-binding protein